MLQLLALPSLLLSLPLLLRLLLQLLLVGVAWLVPSTVYRRGFGGGFGCVGWWVYCTGSSGVSIGCYGSGVDSDLDLTGMECGGGGSGGGGGGGGGLW